MPPEVIETVVRWMNRGNPSAEYASARESQKLMQRFRQHLAAEGGFDLDGPKGYTIIFTSGGSEGNSHVLTSAARAYASKTGKLPHIITGAAEHKSVLACCRQLARDRMIQLTILPVKKVGLGSEGRAGTVDPEELRNAIRSNTCLVSIMAANNETGAINDIRALGAVAHDHKIPFHSDIVQLFGKSTVHPASLNLDAFTVAFHKLHGPPGVGLLALRNDFIEGYGLNALIAGNQNLALRGGTENLPGIAGAFAAYKYTMTDRGRKNQQVRHIRDGIQSALAQRFLVVHVDDYCEARPRVPDGNPMTPRSSRVPAAPRTPRGVALAQKLDGAIDRDAPVIVWLSPSDRVKVLPNTILLSVLRAGGFCNKKMRAALEANGIIISIGSACNASDTGPSHVVDAMDVPPELWPGVLRISLSDETTVSEASTFVKRFAEMAASPEVLV